MKLTKSAISGALAGSINGLLGAGGGMVLVPLLTKAEEFSEEEVFPASVGIIMPLCVVSLTVSAMHGDLPWGQALPYLFGGVPGGLLAGFIGKKIPVKWLHRLLGIIIVWGGIQYLW